MNRRDFIAGLGSAAVLPIAARAQQPAMPVIGFLSPGNEGAANPVIPPFRLGLGEFGYVEGRNVEILHRQAELRFDRLPALAADLVRRHVAVILAAGIAPALAAKSATSTIPIVFFSSVDPVEVGLVASFNRPSGNATGTFFLSTPLIAKRLDTVSISV